MKLEEKMFLRNIKGIAKGFDISVFGIVEYYVRSESVRIIELRNQTYYVPGLPKDLRIIFPQGVCALEEYKSTFIDNFHDEYDSYAEINFKGDNPGW